MLCFSQWGLAQRLIDRNGSARFFSEAPLEDIEATNEQVLGALDLSNGNVAVTMLMKGFHFDKSLMEEHFNENYVESDQYPKATFSGTIEGFDNNQLEHISDTLRLNVNGTIMIHGVERSLTTEVKFYRTEPSRMGVTTNFMLTVSDFDIKVPSLLVKNIAEEVLVTSTFTFDY